MLEFQYKIKDDLGFHARPVGQLVELVKGMDTAVTVTKDGKTVSADQLVALMALDVDKGDVITVTLEDDSDEADVEKVKAFLEKTF